MEKQSEMKKLNLSDQKSQENESFKDIRGCSHYKRKAKFVVSSILLNAEVTMRIMQG
jgi:hypothetical protein